MKSLKVLFTLVVTLLLSSCVLAIEEEGPPAVASDKEIEADLKDYNEDDRFEGINIHDAFSRNAEVENYTHYVIDKHGYPWEEHTLATADGYILTIYRIPGSKVSPPIPRGKKVAFLQHGILSISADWVVAKPERSLAFRLANEGYDVWLGNARGNTHSRKHIYLSPKAKAFWDFSWHEIGQIDLPAQIDYILGVTGQAKLHYIGHSQGTTSFFVMGALRPEYNSKIITMHALAPIAFMSKLKSPFIRAMSPFVGSIDWTLKMLGIYEFFPSNKMMTKGGQALCKNESPFQFVCVNALFLICGYNSEQLDRDLLPEILENMPAGASVNQLVHYGQEVNSGKFRMYDYGYFGNKKRYGSGSPPDYDLKKITAPVALHYGDNDWLAANSDVDKLAAQLPNLIGKFRVGHNKWNHLDFLYAIDLNYYLNDRVVSLMKRYE